MNRIIKFRFWNKKMKQMQYPFDVPMFEFKKSPLDVSDKLWYLKIYEDECEAMQFTGLLDKNGKEIYEGDILMLARGTNDESISKPVTFTAKVYESGFGWGSCGWYPQEIEVIGNQFENPELLTN